MLTLSLHSRQLGGLATTQPNAADFLHMPASYILLLSLGEDCITNVQILEYCIFIIGKVRVRRGGEGKRKRERENLGKGVGEGEGEVEGENERAKRRKGKRQHTL